MLRFGCVKNIFVSLVVRCFGGDKKKQSCEYRWTHVKFQDRGSEILQGPFRLENSEERAIAFVKRWSAQHPVVRGKTGRERRSIEHQGLKRWIPTHHASRLCHNPLLSQPRHRPLSTRCAIAKKVHHWWEWWLTLINAAPARPRRPTQVWHSFLLLSTVFGGGEDVCPASLRPVKGRDATSEKRDNFIKITAPIRGFLQKNWHFFYCREVVINTSIQQLY